MIAFPTPSPPYPHRLGFIDPQGNLRIEQRYGYTPGHGFNADGFAILRRLSDRRQVLVTAEGEELWVLPEGWYTLGSAPDAYGLFPVLHQVDHADPEMWRREGRETFYLGRVNATSLTRRAISRWS